MPAARVLIVDDEQDILDLLEIWLSDDPRCAAVKRADDLDAAVGMAHAWSPTVMIIDFHVGHRTAVEVLPELRRACPHARIVVHTASRLAAETAGATAAGADAVIEKNHYTIDTLIDRVLAAADEQGQPGEATG